MVQRLFCHKYATPAPWKQFYVFLSTAPTGVVTAGTAGLSTKAGKVLHIYGKKRRRCTIAGIFSIFTNKSNTWRRKNVTTKTKLNFLFDQRYSFSWTTIFLEMFPSKENIVAMIRSQHRRSAQVYNWKCISISVKLSNVYEHYMKYIFQT